MDYRAGRRSRQLVQQVLSVDRYFPIGYDLEGYRNG